MVSERLPKAGKNKARPGFGSKAHPEIRVQLRCTAKS